MALLLYNLALIALGAPFLVWLAVDVWRGGRFARGWRAQLTLDLPEVAPGTPLVWLHAASVGETLAVERVLAQLKSRHPELRQLITSTSAAGHELAEKRGIADLRTYLPFDFPGLPGRLLDRVRPKLLIVAETEIWPNLLAAARLRSIPILVINGRLSPERERSYRRLAMLYRQVLAPVRLFLMQAEADAARLVDIGVPQERVRVAGDLKVDRTFAFARTVDGGEVARDLALPPGPVLLAGSTHPGEDAAVRDAWMRLRRDMPDLLLVLAPRHMNKVAAVRAGFERAGVAYRLRSAELAERHAGNPVRGGGRPPVLILDTIGELAGAYAVATLAFVGGTLVPVGGHSVFEPAAFGCPVILGPHDFNFREEGEALEAVGAVARVADADGLYRAARAWLADPPRVRAAGEAGRRVVAEMAGATERTLAVIERTLGS